MTNTVASGINRGVNLLSIKSRARLLRAVNIVLLCALSAASVFAAASTEESESVSVYSHRHYEVDQRLYDRFTEMTGVRVNVINAGADELIERLKAEGERSPADLLVTVDAGRLNRATAEGLLQPVSSDLLEERIPAHLRDGGGHWFGLTKRARVIVTSVDRVSSGAITTYEDLADPRWRGRVVVRSSSNVYNQSLVASIVAALGEEDATAWASGLVGNFAREPQGNDRDQMKAVAAGVADIAVVNTYYLGLLATSDSAEERSVAEQLTIVFPNQDDRGTHVNVSGAGVAAHAPNRENAIRLLEFLVSDEAQSEYAAANYEYPVVEGVPVSEVVASWGMFNEDTLPLTRLGDLNSEAVRAMDVVGWK